MGSLYSMNDQRFHLIRKVLVCSLLYGCGFNAPRAQSGDKIVVTEANQLPCVAYPFEGKAVELVNDLELSPAEVKQLIQLSLDESEDGRRYLINPQRAVSMLRLKP